MGNLRIVAVAFAIVILIAGTKDSNCENILKFSLLSGFDTNYLELKKNNSKLYSGFDFSNFFQPDNSSFSSITNLQIKNYSKNYINFNQEFSYSFKMVSFYSGIIYLNDKNDTQNSLISGYFETDFNIKFIQFSYSIYLKKYLKDYIYGSYKSFMHHTNKWKKKFHKRENKEKDYFQDFNFKLNFENLKPAAGYTINSSNIKKEDYFSKYIEVDYSKYFTKFNFDIYSKFENINYQKKDREDNLFIISCYFEYYFYKNYFFGIELNYKNNNSNFDDESFKRFSAELSIGFIF